MNIPFSFVIPAKAGIRFNYVFWPLAKILLLKRMAAAVLGLVIFIAPTALATPASNTSTTANALPTTLAIPAFQMQYQVLRNGWHIGEATFTLEREGGAWYFHSKAHPVGIASLFVHATFSESSRLQIVNHHIRPLAYAYTDSHSPSHNEHIRFDWKNDVAQDQHGKNKPSKVTIAPGMLDRLSAQLAISRQLAAGAPLADPYRVVHYGKVDDYILRKKKTAEIKTPAGKFKTVLVVRHDPGSKRSTRFWMAPKYAWLPIKMQHVSPGDATYTFALARLQWLGTESSHP